LNAKFPQDKQEPFTRILSEINKIKGVERIRFTSPHPKDVSDNLIEAIASLDKVCEWIHLPLQSGDNTILKKMNRNYTVAHYRKLVQKIRKKIPNISISTDLIVGFCGETEKQLINTYNFFKEISFDLAYISSYSERPGTHAAENFEDNIPKKEKIRRFHFLNDLLRKISLQNNQKYIGKTVEVLVEKIDPKKKQAQGLTRTSKIVFFPAKKVKVGDLIRVKITHAKEWILKGNVV